MTGQDDRSPDEKAKATAKTKASVLEAIGTLIGDDAARRDGAKQKQSPDATKPDAAEDGKGER
ncbi:hypothetical protein [uncultured Sphingomonas sp.]|uniref:hypothetical protein n=1 Tax=uncultured Sphingomonas sp. TaxID=158754 RepID=UPI0025E0F456|nr:hypothetical protein [uncultured Sphingomonas sp.]